MPFNHSLSLQPELLLLLLLLLRLLLLLPRRRRLVVVAVLPRSCLCTGSCQSGCRSPQMRRPRPQARPRNRAARPEVAGRWHHVRVWLWLWVRVRV